MEIQDWFTWSFFVAEVSSFIFAILTIPSVLLKRKGASRAALSWILLLFFLPIVGILLWWLIGRRHMRKRRDRRKEAVEAVSADLVELRSELPPAPIPELALLPIQHLPPELADFVLPPTGGNSVEILIDAAEAYPAMEKAIEEARDHVHFLFYIWQKDKVGERFRDLLIEKAKQGVEVRALYDSLGSWVLTTRFLKPLKEAGGKVGAFLPMSFFSRVPTFNFRNHRKILVCDGEVGFVGGFNIGEEYTRNWRDLAARLRGPVVDQLQEVFADDWHFAAGENLTDRRYFGRWSPRQEGDPGDPATCAVLGSGPETEEMVLRDALFIAITEAQERIYITTPYFIPDPATLVALRTAVYRGVDVRILVPGMSDVKLVQLAARSYYEDLLEAGVKIYEYQPKMLHAKILLFDHKLSVLGSANLDNRSLKLNFEISVFLGSVEVNRRLCELFLGEIEESREVHLEDCVQSSHGARLKQALANLLGPLL